MGTFRGIWEELTPAEKVTLFKLVFIIFALIHFLVGSVFTMLMAVISLVLTLYFQIRKEP